MSNKAIINKLQREEDALREKVRTSIRIDREFAREDDVDLTDEEKRAIKEYWSKYSFAYPEIDYESFKTFKNRLGHMDVRHCPGTIRTSFFHKQFVDYNYSVAYKNKALLGRHFANIPQPKTIVRRMNDYFFDESFVHIAEEDAVRICSEYLAKGEELIVKPNASYGGHGIEFVTNNDTDELKRAFSAMGNRTFAVQVVLHQSPFMSRLNASSVNTIRITTLLHKGKVIPLAALIRVGSVGARVDNYSSGGSLVGIDINTGKCNDWAMANDHSNHHVLPGGLDLREGLTVPNFNEVKALVERAHWNIPYIKMVSWDIALDENDHPLMIECNFAGMLQIHEAVTGPLFGSLMDELLDEYLIRRFAIRFATEDFICSEYSDHVVLEEYIGETLPVVVPKTLRGKEITAVNPDVFAKKSVSSPNDISAPRALMQQLEAALEKQKEKESE